MYITNDLGRIWSKMRFLYFIGVSVLSAPWRGKTRRYYITNELNKTLGHIFGYLGDI